MKMKLIISIAILLFIAPSSYADTLSSYVNKDGKTVWTNSGAGSNGRGNSSTKQIAIADNDIPPKYQKKNPNQASSLSYTTWVTHFMAHGEPRHRAMMLAETQMVQGGQLTSPKPEPRKKPEQPERRIVTKKKHQKKVGTTRKKKKMSPVDEPVTVLGDIRKFKREMRAIQDFNRRATGMLDVTLPGSIDDRHQYNQRRRAVSQNRNTQAAHPKSRRSKRSNCAGKGDKQDLLHDARPGRNDNTSVNTINQMATGDYFSSTILRSNYSPASGGRY